MDASGLRAGFCAALRRHSVSIGLALARRSKETNVRFPISTDLSRHFAVGQLWSFVGDRHRRRRSDLRQSVSGDPGVKSGVHQRFAIVGAERRGDPAPVVRAAAEIDDDVVGGGAWKCMPRKANAASLRDRLACNGANGKPAAAARRIAPSRRRTLCYSPLSVARARCHQPERRGRDGSSATGAGSGAGGAAGSSAFAAGSLAGAGTGSLSGAAGAEASA